MRAVENRRVPAISVRWGNVGLERVGQIFVGRGFVAKEGETVAPGGVVEAVQHPSDTHVRAARVVPSPFVGESQKVHNLGADISDRYNRGRRIRSPRSRLSKTDQRVAAAGAA